VFVIKFFQFFSGFILQRHNTYKTNSAHNFTYQKSARLQQKNKQTDQNKE